MCFNLIDSIDGKNEVQTGANFTSIRFMKVAESSSTYPLNDLVSLATNWTLPTESTLKDFSAVCWYFGKQLNSIVKVPIGLVASCVGYFWI
jgi:sialate O-acetylesterase